MFWGKKTETATVTTASPEVGTISLSPEISNATAVARSSLVNPAAYFQRYGFPGPVHDVASREQFITCYDRKTRNPGWVIEHITRQSLKIKDGSRDSSVFKEDTAIPALFRGQLRDYFRSGYDRGHQAPAADAKFSQNAMDETFFLSNMCPQVGEGFNRDYWAHFEDFCRKLTNSYASVRIVTGPLYLPKKGADGKYRISYEVIGNPPNIAVPTHFFKIIIGEDPSPRLGSPKGVAVGAFVLPNEKIDNSTPLKSFYVPIESIERSSGVEFLPLLPASDRRDLCREVSCDITVREFVKALPAPKQPLGLPAPRN